ncbi:MAG: hypothetical protein HQ517_15345 [SAR324 cluster bacterium]|nr:hypothetical protein [SAR324 cluster bacterium]
MKGMGDFTLITSHPKECLDYDAVIHSHVDPASWARRPEYSDYIKFAPIRNPVGAIYSSCFSINALASEYIQRFIAPEEDDDALRQHLALFKLTNLDFFEGLARHYAAYYKEFITCQKDYTIMKWEDLIADPIPTICHIGDAAGIPLSISEAEEIWGKINGINLTREHKHNFRPNGGGIGGWKKWLVNPHLQIIRDQGLEPLMEELGYGQISDLNEETYTPFQKKIAGYIDRGEIFEDYPDHDLFEFAFNKSNLVSDKFSFNRYNWRESTQIERSSFSDETLMHKIWDIAEEATSRINLLFVDILGLDFEDQKNLPTYLEKIREKHTIYFSSRSPQTFDSAFETVEALIGITSEPPRGLSRLFRMFQS